MARYVDIEKAEYPYMSMSMFGINSKDCKIYNEGVKATEDMIQALPTADVVELEKYNDLREKFVDYACSGTNNLAPYCENRCAECVDGRGWCRYGRSCKGFNPDGERRTDNE